MEELLFYFFSKRVFHVKMFSSRPDTTANDQRKHPKMCNSVALNKTSSGPQGFVSSSESKSFFQEYFKTFNHYEMSII